MDLLKLIKENPYVFAGIVVLILCVIGVSAWYFVSQSSTSNSSSKPLISANSLSGDSSPGLSSPVDCVVDYPQTWGSCSPSGVGTVTGKITTYPSGNGRQCPSLTMTGPCPVDCVVDYTSTWGSCDPVSGIQTATGTVRTNSKNGGATCPPLTMTQKCPVDCVVDYPQSWGSCSSSGVQTATGTITSYPQNGGSGCPSLIKTGTCQAIPEFKGCYSSQSVNGKNVTTPINKGIMNVNDCNTAAKRAGSPYFGMSYWQGGRVNNGKNTGEANCVLPNPNTDPSTVISYFGAPGGNASNASDCPPAGPFTPDCISRDTVNACVVNNDTSAPPGSLGGGWVNAIYNTSV